MASSVEEGERTRQLPIDLIFEILLNLPVKSLLQFKCVCKLWYNLIISPDFITAQHENGNHRNEVSLFCYSCNQKYIFCGPRPGNTVMSFQFGKVLVDDLTIPIEPPEMSGIVGCSNGVVCLSRSPRAYQRDMFVLWNPATRQLTRFGGYNRNRLNRSAESDSGFCFNPIAKKFKLVRVAFFFKKRVAKISIIKTSSGNTWRHKTIDDPCLLSGSWRPNTRSLAISVKTCMYWDVSLGTRGNDASQKEDQYILCFDMIDEMFKRIELPYRANLIPFSSYSLIEMAGYKDSLAVFVHKPDYPGGFECACFDVWVRGDHSWSKKLTCEPSVSFERAFGFISKENVDWIVLRSRSDSTNYLLYDPDTKHTMELSLEDWFPKFFWYRESLVSLN